MWNKLLYAVLGGLLVMLAVALNDGREEIVENMNEKKAVKAAKELRQEVINQEVIKQFNLDKRGIAK